MPLSTRFRRSLYGILALLFVTGVVWLVADARQAAATATLMLMLHGGAAMAALLVLGALFPLHLLPAWRRRKNLASGLTVAAANALLVVTAFGLYYVGSDWLRDWTADLHIALGLAFPALVLVHVIFGRRNSLRRVLPDL